MRYSADLKARVLAACAEPGAVVAHVAREHGLYASLVYTWRRSAAEAVNTARPVVREHTEFVALPFQASPFASEIRIELHAADTMVNVHWPLAAAPECARWLRELLA